MGMLELILRILAVSMVVIPIVWFTVYGCIDMYFEQKRKLIRDLAKIISVNLDKTNKKDV